MNTSSRPTTAIVGPYVPLGQLSQFTPGTTGAVSSLGLPTLPNVGFVAGRIVPPSVGALVNRLGISPGALSPSHVAQRAVPALVNQVQAGAGVLARNVSNLFGRLGG